jgi:D-alanyl-D-alanine dipeptidase
MSDVVPYSQLRIATTPAHECGEPLVDLRELPRIAVDRRMADPDELWAMVRARVAERLVSAQRLLPPGFGLLVVDGCRTPATQWRYFSEHVDGLRAACPDCSADACEQQATACLAPPEVAAHVAGAGVDVTLCDSFGLELAMGREIDSRSHARYSAQCSFATELSDQAHENRALLRRVLGSAGLVNHPVEWWHWSYGDRYWATVTGADAARYGAVTLGSDTSPRGAP